MNAVLPPANVTQMCWQSVNIIITCISRNNSRFPCLFGRYSRNRWPTLHRACTAQCLQSTVCTEECETEVGEDQNFSSFAGPQGTAAGAFQAGFTVAMRTEVRVNTPHRAGTTSSLALRPLTKRTRTFDWAEIWNLCGIYRTEKYTNNSTFPSLWPGVHTLCCGDAVQISERKRTCGRFNVKLMINCLNY